LADTLVQNTFASSIKFKDLCLAIVIFEISDELSKCFLRNGDERLYAKVTLIRENRNILISLFKDEDGNDEIEDA